MRTSLIVFLGGLTAIFGPGYLLEYIHFKWTELYNSTAIWNFYGSMIIIAVPITLIALIVVVTQSAQKLADLADWLLAKNRQPLDRD